MGGIFIGASRMKPAEATELEDVTLNENHHS